ncbi:MAG TPA: Nramp family divalent metal transporter, partial [Methanocorpusculum sp.]|nr:Nramp family divalent metal transporter [Methanocorpusculum sp.]
MNKNAGMDWKTRLKKRLVFFGPGLLLAITAAGEAGIADALDIGAHFGMSLVWVVLLALIFKYAFTTGIARYTLATGKTIFQGLTSIPGPKNWAAYLTVIAYLIDAIAIGAMVLFAGTFVDYLIPGSYPFYLICLLILILSLVILRTHIYHHFEKVMAAVVLIVGVSLLVFMTQYPGTLIETVSGIVPSIPEHSEKEILAIIGAVGSGLMLMLYSVWLEKKIRVRNEDPDTKEEDKFRVGDKKAYREYLRSVRLDILFGFILVAIITIGFMAIGRIGMMLSFIPHGTEFSVDLMITMVLKLYHSIPFGNLIFFIFVIVVFFGATVIGLDARASAITKLVKEMRKNAGHPVKNTSLVYNLCLLCFSLIVALVILFNQPLTIMLYVSLICAIFFGIFGFILLYLNTKLPEYAQGSRLWMLFIGIGSVLSIYFALVLEGSIIGLGFALGQKMLVILVGLYLFSKSRMFKRLTDGVGTLADKFWLVAILGTISILGTMWG